MLIEIMPVDPRGLGRAIKHARTQAGLSQARLAAAIGSDDEQGTIVSRMELARTGVSLDQLVAIAETCSVTVLELLVAAGTDSPAVRPDVSTRALIEGDPSLDPTGRELVLRMFDYALGVADLRAEDGYDGTDDEA